MGVASDAAAQELLRDAFTRLIEHVDELTDGLTDEVSDYRPTPDANSIAWLIWHSARVQDIQLADVAGVEQVWFRDGWVDRFGLDLPRNDTGYGHGAEQVAKVRAPAVLLAGYYHAVHKLSLEYIASVTGDELARVVDTNWDPPVTASARLVSIIDDCAQHLGQRPICGESRSRFRGVRFAATLVFWLATTVGLAIAVPVVWTQRNVVEADGYAAMAQQAAADPALQSAMAAELTTRAIALIAAHNGGRRPADSTQVQAVAAAFTAGPSFPRLFAQANRVAHDWLFTDPPAGQDGNEWMVDLAPMLNDSSIQQLLHSYHVTVPANLAVPVTVSVPSMSQPLRQGELSQLSTWGRWASKGAAAFCGFCALLTLLAARRRGKALTSLGVSALLVGAAGWAGIETGARYVNNALNLTAGNVRQIADVMVGEAGASLRQWLNLTLAAGAGLVIVGVFVAMTGSVVLGKQGS